MATLLFVLLAWILAVEYLTRKTALLRRTFIVRAANSASTPEGRQLWSRASGLDRSGVEEMFAPYEYERGLADQEDAAGPPSSFTKEFP